MMGNNGQMNGKFKEKKKGGKGSSRRLIYDGILDSLMTP